MAAVNTVSINLQIELLNFSRIGLLDHCVKKCPYSELFRLSLQSTVQSISPYSVRMRANEDQNNSEYGHFLHSKCLHIYIVGDVFLTIFDKSHTRKACSCEQSFAIYRSNQYTKGPSRQFF